MPLNIINSNPPGYCTAQVWVFFINFRMNWSIKGLKSHSKNQNNFVLPFYATTLTGYWTNINRKILRKNNLYLRVELTLTTLIWIRSNNVTSKVQRNKSWNCEQWIVKAVNRVSAQQFTFCINSTRLSSALSQKQLFFSEPVAMKIFCEIAILRFLRKG